MANILTIQMQSKLGQIEENLKKVKSFLSSYRNQPLDLVVLPEFFATSIDYLKPEIDENGGYVLDEVRALASEYNTNFIAGSVVRQKTDGRYYNSSFAIDRRGNILKVYDKIHLFNYFGGAEGSSITAGNEICTVDFDFAKTGMGICFDIRYPMLFNEFLKQQVQLIVLPTAWIFPSIMISDPEQRKSLEDIWQSMAKTRAYDNEAFFVVCNQTGDVGHDMEGLGNSMVISPYGKIISLSDTKEQAMLTSIDISEARKCKQEFPKANLL